MQGVGRKTITKEWFCLPEIPQNLINDIHKFLFKKNVYNLEHPGLVGLHSLVGGYQCSGGTYCFCILMNAVCSSETLAPTYHST